MHSEIVDSFKLEIGWVNARVHVRDFLVSVCPRCEDMMFLQPSSASIAQPGPKYNPHTDHETLAEDRAGQRPTE